MSDEKKTVLSMRHINKTFPGVKALSDAQLTLREGEIHALMGENGAGKSTFCNCLCGLLKPKNGEILYKGKRLSEKARTKLFGMVMQEVNHQLFSDSVKK